MGAGRTLLFRWYRVATGTPVIHMPLWCQGDGDLAWTTDMAALALLFPPLAEAEQWKVLVFFWLPSERISDIETYTRVRSVG